MTEVVKVNSVLFFEDDRTAKRVLESEARKLLGIAQKEWIRVMGTYSPKEYVRTGKAFKSIKMTEVRKVGFGWTIDVTFDNDLAYHDSVIAKTEPKGHAIWLNHAGWRVKRGSHRDTEYFGYRKGSGYLFEVFQKYNKIKDPRVSLTIMWERKR